MGESSYSNHCEGVTVFIELQGANVLQTTKQQSIFCVGHFFMGQNFVMKPKHLYQKRSPHSGPSIKSPPHINHNQSI